MGWLIMTPSPVFSLISGRMAIAWLASLLLEILAIDRNTASIIMRAPDSNCTRVLVNNLIISIIKTYVHVDMVIKVSKSQEKGCEFFGRIRLGQQHFDALRNEIKVFFNGAQIFEIVFGRK
jgi:hypothetical protein